MGARCAGLSMSIWPRISSPRRIPGRREMRWVQSGIAKGALRPKSRFGAALQLLSQGQAQLLMKENRELHVLTAFDLRRLHVGLARDLERYACACTLAEVMLRFAPPDPHPESFDLLQEALEQLETAAAG